MSSFIGRALPQLRCQSGCWRIQTVLPPANSGAFNFNCTGARITAQTPNPPAALVSDGSPAPQIKDNRDKCASCLERLSQPFVYERHIGSFAASRTRLFCGSILFNSGGTTLGWMHSADLF